MHIESEPDDQESTSELIEQSDSEEDLIVDEEFLPDSEQIYAWNFFPDVPF